MSALMDNPLGNVAMLFTQFDFTGWRIQPSIKRIISITTWASLSFPKGLGKNWNLINRVVWNVPSMPVDQDKIDDGKSSKGYARPTMAP